MAQAVAQLAPFVNRTGRFRRDMAGNPARKRELREELFEPRLILRDVRIKLAVSPLEVRVADKGRPSVSRAGNIDHVEIVLIDEAVEVDVDEVLPGCCPPVSQE